MEPPWEVGEKVYINGTGHMTNMAAMLFYGKPSKISYKTNTPIIMKLGMEQYVLKLYKVYINDYPELTLTPFKTMSNFAKLFCTYSSSRYQVSVYRTIGLLVYLLSKS